MIVYVPDKKYFLHGCDYEVFGIRMSLNPRSPFLMGLVA